MEKSEQTTIETKRVIEVVGGIIRREEKYLLGKRPEGKSLGGHWEFIGGKKIALDIVNEKIHTALTHAYPDRTIHLTLIDCEPAPVAEPTALEHSELGWFSPEEMASLDFCPADAELLPVIFPS